MSENSTPTNAVATAVAEALAADSRTPEWLGRRSAQLMAVQGVDFDTAFEQASTELVNEVLDRVLD